MDVKGAAADFLTQGEVRAEERAWWAVKLPLIHNQMIN